MALLMTHSLLSSWRYLMQENPYDDATQEDTSMEEFLRVLRREPTPTNEAMQNGIDFENLVTDIVNNQPREGAKWYEAAEKVARYVRGGQLQLVAQKKMEISGEEFLLYGRLDALKAGKIFDIKFSKGYDRGKYFESTQHPMYMELVPEAESFTYLVSNGTDVWTEEYRRDETVPIWPVIQEFLWWLKLSGNFDIYKEHWGEKK